MAASSVPQPKVATETRQLIKDNKKVEEVFERIGSSVVALAVSKSPSHEVVQLEILETGYFSTSVLKSSGPLRTANSAGLFVHEFDALNAGVTYTARASFQADASSTPVHSETITFTTLTAEAATEKKLSKLQQERDVAVWDLNSEQGKSSSHRTLQAASKEQLSAVQQQLDKRESALRELQRKTTQIEKAKLAAESAAKEARLQSEALGSSIRELRDDINHTEKQIKQLLEDAGVAANTSESAVQQLSALHQHMQRQSEEAASLRLELQAAKEQAGSSTAEHQATLDDLQMQLQQETDRADAASKRLAACMAELEDARAQVAEAKAAKEALATATAREAENRDAQAELQDRLDKLQAQSREETAALRSQLREREEELSRVQSQLAVAEAKAQSTEDSAAATEESVSALTADVQRLQEERSALAAKLQAAEEASAAALAEAQDKMQSALASQQEEYQQQLQALGAKLQAAEQAQGALQSEAGGNTEQLEAVRSGLMRLASSVGCKHDSDVSAPQLLALIEATVQDMADGVAQVATAASASVAGVPAEDTPEAPTPAQLESQSSSTSSTASTGARTLLQSVVGNLTKAHEKALRRVLVLQKQLRDTKEEASTAAATARNDISTLHRQVQSLRRDDDERAALKAQLDAAEAAATQHRLDAETAQQDLQSAERRVAELQRAQRHLAEEKEELETNLADALSAARICRSDMSRLNQELADLKADGTSSSTSSGSGGVELLQLQRTCDGLRRQLQEERDQAAAQEAEMQHTLAEAARLRRTVADLEAGALQEAAAEQDAKTMYELDCLRRQVRLEATTAIGSQRLDVEAVLELMSILHCDARTAVGSLIQTNGDLQKAITLRMSSE